MKTRYFFITLFLICTSLSFAQDNWLDKYANQDGITSVYISKAMFQLMPDINVGNVNLKTISDKINSLSILTTEKKDVATKLDNSIGQEISSDYAELMRAKDDSSVVVFRGIQQGEIINVLLLSVSEPSGYTVIKIDGKFTLEDIRKMSN